MAAKKTAGVLGDDLALNAQQVSGVNSNREIPVVWAVAKGSAINKAILVPMALTISYFAPWAVLPLLMIGGIFLCYEGVEKLWHSYCGGHDAEDEAHESKLHEAVKTESIDLMALEKDKIKGAIRTDFVLSAEIIVITLGTVAKEIFLTQVFVLIAISLLMTVGVYGLVACIVKLDDLGLYFSVREGTGLGKELMRRFGRLLLAGAPILMKTLSIAGTVAMFMVGGHIIIHGIEEQVPAFAHWLEHLGERLHEIKFVGAIVSFIVLSLIDIAAGLIAGAITVIVVTMLGKLLFRKKEVAH